MDAMPGNLQGDRDGDGVLKGSGRARDLDNAGSLAAPAAAVADRHRYPGRACVADAVTEQVVFALTGVQVKVTG